MVEKRQTCWVGAFGFIGISVVSIVVNLSILRAAWINFRSASLYVLLPYYTYVLVLGKHERRKGNLWPWFSRRFLPFPAMRRYLSMKLVVDEKLKVSVQQNKQPQFVFAVSPHGTNADFRILLQGMLLDDPHLGDMIAPNLRVLAATVLFRIPFVRELALWTGCIDASRPIAEKALREGLSLMVLPDGQAGQMHTVSGREIVYLLKRLGFVKLCLRYQVPIVPVYVFGVSDYYTTSSWGKHFRLRLVKNTGIAIPFCWGLLGSPLCPKPVATTVVMGSPLICECKDPSSPTDLEIKSAHTEYCKALTQLFDSHKHSLGYGDRQLEII